MDTVTDKTPPGWLEILKESEAEIDAGLFVSSEEVHRLLQGSITQLEQKAATPQSEATKRR